MQAVTAGCELSYDTGCTAVTNSLMIALVWRPMPSVYVVVIVKQTLMVTISACRADGTLEDTCVGPTVDDCGDCDGTFFSECIRRPLHRGSVGCLTADGKCNCNGDTLDALNICGGDCDAVWMKMVFATRGMA